MLIQSQAHSGLRDHKIFQNKSKSMAWKLSLKIQWCHWTPAQERYLKYFTLFRNLFSLLWFSIGFVYIRDEPIRSLTWQVLLWQISLKGGEKIIIRFSRVAVNALFELSQYYWFLSNFCWAKTSGTSLMHHLYFLSHHHSHHHYTRLCAWSSPSSTKHASIYFSSCIPV